MKVLTVFIMRDFMLSIFRGIVSKETIWDYLLFRNVQELMGGNVDMLFCASAPVSKEVMRFFRCASGCLVMLNFVSCSIFLMIYLLTLFSIQ